MATHSSTLALKIPWTEELCAGYCPWGPKELGTTERLNWTKAWPNWKMELSLFQIRFDHAFHLIGETFALASLVAQTEKLLSTMWETWVRSLGWEDSLEKEMATHLSTLALKIPWTEELGAGYYPWGRKESVTTDWLHFHFHFLWQWRLQSPRRETADSLTLVFVSNSCLTLS